MAADRFIRLPAVVETLGVSRAQVYVLIKRGEFPEPTKLGKLSVWSERQVQNWMQSKLAA